MVYKFGLWSHCFIEGLRGVEPWLLQSLLGSRKSWSVIKSVHFVYNEGQGEKVSRDFKDQKRWLANGIKGTFLYLARGIAGMVLKFINIKKLSNDKMNRWESVKKSFPKILCYANYSVTIACTTYVMHEITAWTIEHWTKKKIFDDWPLLFCRCE